VSGLLNEAIPITVPTVWWPKGSDEARHSGIGVRSVSEAAAGTVMGIA